ncbi:Alcohol dehydrogenase transcription factor Myb/SANT-like [Popillia japonica]|uniref:Alcohol dehydrogenase transcription factor Myb/SANT-like n=1 Tax=Popillia japonica TaxID=7064 RepID=A0AAW1L8M8_POPJA
MIRALIQLYETHPCLYISTRNDYDNKAIREKAWEKITAPLNAKYMTSFSTKGIQKKIHGLRTQYLAEIRQIKGIQKKIHGLRTQYLAEIRQIKKSKVTEASSSTVHKPKLWCYEHVAFLGKVETASEGESNLVLNSQTLLDSENVKILNLYLFNF